ncbi:MAG: hypothetical protein WBW12_21570 [Terriglobales bacterium]
MAYAVQFPRSPETWGKSRESSRFPELSQPILKLSLLQGSQNLPLGEYLENEQY